MALGDSVTVGVGDRTDHGWRGWAALLAESLAVAYDLRFTNLAGVGATARQVRDEQLPVAVDLRPHLASLVVGVNDTMRSSFDPVRLRADVLASAEALSDAGADLLLVRFHDHGRVFGLPRMLRGPLARRIAVVNAVYDEVHARFGGAYVDLAASPEIYARATWSVDRLHPSENGHRLLARTFAGILRPSGPAVTLPALEPGGGVVPTPWADLAWMATEGLPWVGRRARDLGPWAARLAVSETAERLRRRGRSAATRAPVGSSDLL